MTEGATKVIGKEREDHGPGYCESTGETHHAEQEVGTESDQWERDHDQQIDAHEGPAGQVGDQLSEQVLGDVDAREVIQVHAEREPELLADLVIEALPDLGVHVRAEHVSAGPARGDPLEHRGEDDHGQRCCDRGRYGCLKKRSAGTHGLTMVDVVNK